AAEQTGTLDGRERCRGRVQRHLAQQQLGSDRVHVHVLQVGKLLGIGQGALRAHRVQRVQLVETRADRGLHGQYVVQGQRELLVGGGQHVVDGGRGGRIVFGGAAQGVDQVVQRLEHVHVRVL